MDYSNIEYHCKEISNQLINYVETNKKITLDDQYMIMKPHINELISQIPRFDITKVSIIKELGSGAFSEVYLIEFEKKEYALKIMEIKTISPFIEIFMLDLLRDLDFIPKVYSFGIVDTPFVFENMKYRPPFFVIMMELVRDAIPLEDFKDIDDKIIDQMKHCVDVLLSMKIDIRDFGGSNILLDKNRKVWIIDFNHSYIYGHQTFDYRYSYNYILNKYQHGQDDYLEWDEITRSYNDTIMHIQN